MRYIREHIGALGKSAHAYQDTITGINVDDRLVSIVSEQPGMRVVSQFSRVEMHEIARRLMEVETWEQREARRYPLGGLWHRFARFCGSFHYRLTHRPPPQQHQQFTRE